MKRSVALFDFDNTIAHGDSIARLLQYDLKHKPWHFFHFLPVGLYYIGYLCHLCSIEKVKDALLFPLRSMNEQELVLFYQNEVSIHYYPQVLQELKQRKQEGCFIIVCTASCEAYMKYHDLPIDAMIGTRFENGHIVGKNCKNEEKVPRILTCLKEQDIVIDYEHSYAYSDSDSDLPMLEMVKHQKRVLLKSGNIVDFHKNR